MRIQCLRVFIATNAHRCANVPGIDFDCIKRPGLQNTQARIGLVFGISQIAVVGGTAFAKITVLT